MYWITSESGQSLSVRHKEIYNKKIVQEKTMKIELEKRSKWRQMKSYKKGTERTVCFVSDVACVCTS